MKLLFIIVLAVVPGLQGIFDVRAFSYNPVERGIEHIRQDRHLKNKHSLSAGDTNTKQPAEENKASASAAELYDTLMPALSLFLILWLSWSVTGVKEKTP